MLKGNLTTHINVPGDEQLGEDNFTQVSLKTGKGKFLAASLRIQTPRDFQLPDHVQTPKDLEGHLQTLLTPLQAAGFDIELLIGSND